MEVELNIFSGRSNPGWKLSTDQAKFLLEQISVLEDTGSPVIDKGLGYNGFTITNPNKSLDEAERIEIRNGIAVVYHNNIISKKLDPERTLEKWLLLTGKQFLDPAILKEIEKEIGK